MRLGGPQWWHFGAGMRYLTRGSNSCSPQGGAIKLYKSLACPLDGYELLLFSLSGHDGKTYPLCPFCYSNPPFEGALKASTRLCLGWAPGLCAMCRWLPRREH
jgi:hypothetical protein